MPAKRLCHHLLACIEIDMFEPAAASECVPYHFSNAGMLVRVCAQHTHTHLSTPAHECLQRERAGQAECRTGCPKGLVLLVQQ
eukprot:scaffold232923_cov18-Tisochrysis_lutea.AAC.1